MVGSMRARLTSRRQSRSSTASASSGADTVRDRSASVRAGRVTGTRSRSVCSVTADRCTFANWFRPLRPGGTVISIRPGRNPEMLNSTAAALWETTAPGPATRHAANAR